MRSGEKSLLSVPCKTLSSPPGLLSEVSKAPSSQENPDTMEQQKGLLLHSPESPGLRASQAQVGGSTNPSADAVPEVLTEYKDPGCAGWGRYSCFQAKTLYSARSHLMSSTTRRSRACCPTWVRHSEPYFPQRPNSLNPQMTSFGSDISVLVPSLFPIRSSRMNFGQEVVEGRRKGRRNKRRRGRERGGGR